MRKSDSRRNLCSKEVTREYFFRKGVDNAIKCDKIELFKIEAEICYLHKRYSQEDLRWLTFMISK